MPRIKFNSSSLQPTALVRRADSTQGIATRVAENLADEWPSGATIIFWETGKHSDANEASYELINDDLWSLLKITSRLKTCKLDEGAPQPSNTGPE